MLHLVFIFIWITSKKCTAADFNEQNIPFCMCLPPLASIPKEQKIHRRWREVVNANLLTSNCQLIVILRSRQLFWECADRASCPRRQAGRRCHLQVSRVLCLLRREYSVASVLLFAGGSEWSSLLAWNDLEKNSSSVLFNPIFSKTLCKRCACIMDSFSF